MLAEIVATALILAWGPPAPTSVRGDASGRAGSTSALARYLTRPTSHGPRHLDHGVMEVAVAGGFPHLYRVQLRLGLLDHLSIGATAHWLAGQKAPAWSPVMSVAFVRRSWLEIGVSYHQVLHPPPRIDEDPLTPGFRERTHYILAGTTFSRGWFAAGFDVGVANVRVIDPAQTEGDELFVRRTRLAGGLHLRLGTRRFGLTLQAQAPDETFEALADVRFGLFEKRQRGGWLDY